MACRDHFPFISDEACVGSIAALFVIEVIVAAISVGIIIVVLWRWCSQCGTADDTKEACELEDTNIPTSSTSPTSTCTDTTTARGYGNILLPNTSEESMPETFPDDNNIGKDDTSLHIYSELDPATIENAVIDQVSIYSFISDSEEIIDEQNAAHLDDDSFVAENEENEHRD